MRPTFARIDIDAIRHNVTVISDLIAPSELCAVVKADGYGHGDAPVASAALEAGATRLAVALVEEGVRLREAGISTEVLILSEPGPEFAGELVEWELTPTVYSGPFATALGQSRFAGGVHVNIDTGMHRVGVAPNDLNGLLAAIDDADLHVDGVYTHLAVADTDPEYTHSQIASFDEAIEGMGVGLVHIANTPGAILFPEARRDMSRVGLGIYGLHPCDATRDVVDLRPAMSIVTRVSHVQRLRAGERLSYGRVRALDSDATIATIPIGYADGLWRGLTAGGHALIGGQAFPFAGTVTMDQTMIDVGDAEVGPGDEVVLLGSQGDVEVTADDWAAQADTINYEVVCSIGPRVPRRYVS